MTTELIIQKLEEFGKAASAAQAKATEVEKKMDGYDAAQIKKISEDAAKSLEEAQEFKLKLKAVEEANLQLQKLYHRPGNGGGENGVEEKYSHEFSRFLRGGSAVSLECVKEISSELARKSFFGVSDERLQHEIKTLQEGVNPTGGYFVRPSISATIVKRVFETSPVRSVANIETSSSDVLEMLVDDNEADTGWVGEVSPRGDTGTPDIGQLKIPIHELYAQPRATQRLLDDAGFNVESWLAGKVSDAFGRKESNAFVVGDGASKPKGFLSYAAWSVNGVYERNKIEQIESGSATTFTADGIKRLKNSLIESYQANAVFMVKRESFEDIIILKDSNGRYLLNLENSLKLGDDKILLGKPVIFAHDIPAVAADQLSLVYGDFKMGYTIADRLGMRVVRDELTNKPFVRFYTIKRVGGAVTNFEALKIQKIAA